MSGTVAVSPPWGRELIGGATGSLVTLGVVLTLGLIAYAPLGATAAAAGVTASFTAACVGGLVHALLDRARLPLAGPSSATALIVAGLMAGLVGQPGATLPALLACAGLAAIGAGLVMFALGALRLGRLAQFVPQPVLAGFMNGIAVLIVIAQLPALLGVASVAALADPAAWQPLALLLGLGTAIVAWAVAARHPRAPAQLIGLAAGLATWLLLQALWPQARLGLVIGPLPPLEALPGLHLQRAEPQALGFVAAHARPIVVAALTIGTFGALESIVSALAIDQVIGERRDVDHMLRTLGLANIAGGLLAGLPVVQLRARALAVWQAGGRSRRASLVSAAVDAGLLLFGAPLLAQLPRAVLAGVMLTVAVLLADRWTRRLLERWARGERSGELRRSLATVAVVAALTVFAGFPWAIAVGLLLSAALFLRTMNHSLLRARYDAAVAPSRRRWPVAQEALLRPLRHRIVVLELDGALFFGSGQRLAAEAAALPAGTRVLVLDCSRLSSVDASGALALEQLAQALVGRGVRLLLAGATGSNAFGRQLLALGNAGGEASPDWHPDTDRAVEAAERLLLDEAGGAALPTEVPLEASPLLDGLDAAQVARLATAMPARELAAGERLFAQGDPGDALFVLTRGAVTVIAQAGAGADGVARRYLVVTAGMLLGETAMLDGGGRSAGAVADEPTTVRQLDAATLERLSAEDPALVARLHRNLAAVLARRLRDATALR